MKNLLYFIIRIIINKLTYMLPENNSPNTDPNDIKGIQYDKTITFSEDIVFSDDKKYNETIPENNDDEYLNDLDIKQSDPEVDTFEIALEKVLIFEGGYVDHPNDPGGETNFGITKAVYDNYRKSKDLEMQSVRYIEQNEIREIYYNLYWKKGNCHNMRPFEAIAHFDSCVNHGIRQSSLFIQRAVVNNGQSIKIDGMVGPKTLDALSKCNQKDIIDHYIKQRDDFYNMLVNRNDKLGVFLRGWLRRISELKKFIYKKANF